MTTRPGRKPHGKYPVPSRHGHTGSNRHPDRWQPPRRNCPAPRSCGHHGSTASLSPCPPSRGPHHQSVAGTQLIQNLRQFRSGLQGTGSRVGEDPVAAGRLQRVLLQGRVLVPRRYPCVAQQMSQPDNVSIPAQARKNRYIESGTEFRYKNRGCSQSFGRVGWFVANTVVFARVEKQISTARRGAPRWSQTAVPAAMAAAFRPLRTCGQDEGIRCLLSREKLHILTVMGITCFHCCHW